MSSVVVLLSSLLFLAQELTPIVRTDTRTRMSRKYLRKLKMDIILLHEGIKNLNYSVSIILPNEPLIITNNRPMSTICQNFHTLCGEERRRTERRMSICFTWFPISGLGKPKLYQNMWCFTRIGKIVEGVCEL